MNEQIYTRRIVSRVFNNLSTEMPSYPYEPGCESRTDSLLTPGMDNTRHFYSITAVAGTV